MAKQKKSRSAQSSSSGSIPGLGQAIRQSMQGHGQQQAQPGQSSSTPYYYQQTSATGQAPRPGQQSANPRDELINSAISYGTNLLGRLHPDLAKYGTYLVNRHLDTKAVSDKFDRYLDAGRRNQLSPEKMYHHLMKGIVDSVAKGEVFDNVGKGLILRRETLEKKTKSGKGIPGFFSRLAAKRELGNEDYIEKAARVWGAIAESAKEGGYDLPDKLKEPLRYLDVLGFAGPAIHLLKAEGLMKESTYREIKRNMTKGAYEASRQGEEEIKSMSMYQRVAALVSGIFGLGILAFNSGITGAVIGTSGKLAGGAIGIVLVIASCILFLFSPEENKKRGKSRKRR